MSELPGRLVLLGHPVVHSLSPAFQNAALRRAGLPLVYEALDVDPAALAPTLDALVRERAAGNVTSPHKEAVAARCRRVSPLAGRVGAVNTFWVSDGALVGDNTDVGGFVALLDTAAPAIDRTRPAAVLGAGGAASAVLAALTDRGFARVRLHGRTRARAAALGARHGDHVTIALSAEVAVEGAALVVNATPLGLHGEPGPVDIAAMAPDAAVIDVVYRPGDTPWVRAARARGLRAEGGLTMLLAQGALAFERWFGFAPDRAAMREAVEQ